MPRRVQDITPGDRRSIRNIPVERPRPQAEKRIASDQDYRNRARQSDGERPASGVRTNSVSASRGHDIPIRRLPMTPPAEERSGRGGRGRFWMSAIIGAVVILAIAGYIASGLLSHATFTIVPKELPVTVGGTYIAQSIPNGTALVYKLIPLYGSATTTVPAISGGQVSTKASGSITVYNAYSSQAQRLIAGTRLADNSGLIYRLTSSIVIPGYTTSSSGAIIPGTATAVMVADQPGSSYNISGSDAVSDFKIVAYKGTPRYVAMYARLASGVTGGFVGQQQKVDPGVLASTTAMLQSEITGTLLTQAAADAPSGSIMYDGAYAASFSQPVILPGADGTATVSLQGVVYGITFDESSLIDILAGSSTIENFGGFSYTAPGLSSLSFAIANPSDFSPLQKNALVIRLKGSFELVGVVPVDELKAKFAGKSLSETQDILKPYDPVIESGSGELTPPWASVPSDTSRISINVEQP